MNIHSQFESNDTNNESLLTDEFSQIEDDTLGEKLLQAGMQFDKFYTPFLCLLGIFGNSLSLIVFCFDSKYRQNSSSYYLSALAVSDSGFLLNLFAVWLETIHGGIITSYLTCPLVMYLGQVTCFVSVYLTVGFSLERYIAVNFPFAKSRVCTISNAKKFILGVVSTALLIFSYAWIIAKVVVEKRPKQTTQACNCNNTFDFPKDSTDSEVNYVCTVPDEYFKISEIANYIDSAVTLIIPFMLITFFNIRIAVSVRRFLSLRKNIAPSFPARAASAKRCASKADDSPKRIFSGKKSLKKTEADKLSKDELDGKRSKRTDNEEIPGSSRKRLTCAKRASVCRRHLNESQQPNPAEMRVTKMLLLVSTVFLALNLPLHAIRCTQFIQVTTGSVLREQRQDFIQALQPWANMLFNTNFAVNFFLYCVSGSKFRKALREILSRGFNGRKSTTFPGSSLQRDGTILKRT